MWVYIKRTLPDYLHRPYIFRRGQLTHFLFFWVSWEVFHMVLCLMICIVRTYFGGDSYRVFVSGFLGKFFTMCLYTKRTLPDYLHRPYIFRRGQLSRFFCLGFLGSFSHGTLPDYLHRPYIFRRGQLPRFFCLGFPGICSHGTLPDYLHRPYIVGRGQLSRFLFWVPWRDSA